MMSVSFKYVCILRFALARLMKVRKETNMFYYFEFDMIWAGWFLSGHNLAALNNEVTQKEEKEKRLSQV